MSEITEQIMRTPTHHHLFSDKSSINGPSLTKIYANLVVPLSSSDRHEATSIPQKLDNGAYPKKSLCLVDGHDDNDDDVDDNADHEHGGGSIEWGGRDATVESEGIKLEDRTGLVRCSYALSITSNYIHGMEESSGSALGNKMDHTGVEKVWSNEKHNAYLDLMEANFMRDMYAHNYFSLEPCGNQPHSQSESESESETSVIYTGRSSDIMDEMMTTEDAPQCMKISTSSSSSSSSSSSFLRIRRKGGINYINNAKKEKGHSHASTTSTSKRRRSPSFATPQVNELVGTMEENEEEKKDS